LKYTIEITPQCNEMLLEISDNKVRQILFNDISSLENNPESKGKVLNKDLEGLYSIRSYSQKYRIIYSVEGEKVLVNGVALINKVDKKNLNDSKFPNKGKFAPSSNPNFSTKNKSNR